MTRAAWDELVEGGVAPIANADYYKDVEKTIAWADRVIQATSIFLAAREAYWDIPSRYQWDNLFQMEAELRVALGGK